METPNGSRRFLRPLMGEAISPPPVWLMRQAGRYLPEYLETRAKAGDFITLCMTPDYAVEVTLQPIRRYGFDAAILFADILLLPMALGRRLTFAAGEGPRLDPVRDGAAVASLTGEGAAGRLSPVYETVRRLRAELPDEVALIGFAGSPWTVATYMVAGEGGDEQRAAKLFAARDPQGFRALLDTLSEATIAYLAEQIEAGADAIQLFDTWAAGLSDPWFEDFVVAPTARITGALRARYPHVPVIGFPRGVGARLGHYAARTGVQGLGLDYGAPLDFAVRTVPETVALQGNLDPALLVAGGPVMAAEVRRIRDAMAGRPFIFNLGHGIVPETPPEHVADLMRLVREEA